MKTNYLAFFFLLTTSFSNSQNKYKDFIYKIGFESPVELEKYDTESEFVLGYENDDYAVDIELLHLKDKNPKSKNEIKLEARDLAYDLGLRDVVNIGELPLIENGYCVKANEVHDGLKNPVFVLYIINFKLSILYEATIYCYNNNTTGGLEIANTFEILE